MLQDVLDYSQTSSCAVCIPLMRWFCNNRAQARGSLSLTLHSAGAKTASFSAVRAEEYRACAGLLCGTSPASKLSLKVCWLCCRGAEHDFDGLDASLEEDGMDSVGTNPSEQGLGGQYGCGGQGCAPLAFLKAYGCTGLGYGALSSI